MLKLFYLILLSNTTNTDKVKSIYLLTQVEEVSISCAIIHYETGWLSCKNCALDGANLFGFYYKKKYLKFKSYSHSIEYYQKWQNNHWGKFHKKYPNKNYYEFLKWVGYCDNMSNYVKTIKYIQRN